MNKVEYGSTAVSPVEDNSPEPEKPQVEETKADGQPVKEEPPVESKLEKMLKDSQSMIGKQGKMIGDLKAKLESFSKPKEEPAGPAPDAMIGDILRKMEDGEMSMQDGIAQALKINSQLTASQVMQQLEGQRQQEEVGKMHQNFLKKNPDYEEVRDSGALQPYLDADPMADEYVAYHLLKKDQEKAALQADYEAKIKAAKEEGAKLAQGADAASKVVGKQGASPVPNPINRPFKNNQEASDAMLAELRRMRGQ